MYLKIFGQKSTYDVFALYPRFDTLFYDLSIKLGTFDFVNTVSIDIHELGQYHRLQMGAFSNTENLQTAINLMLFEDY